ncbi:MAG: hypothetical protein HOM11_13040 [Methylococcales bacterium]|jgi:hypothetical protein|nr:hypothetical protein [Methylococcales bacterium]MBT7444580.1 hypothetical protein [Methylococcales bacterium]
MTRSITEKQFQSVLNTIGVPSERCLPSAVNARWFLRSCLAYRDQAQFEKALLLAKKLA